MLFLSMLSLEVLNFQVEMSSRLLNIFWNLKEKVKTANKKLFI